MFNKLNEGNSAASFCHQLAAWVPDMLCNFYLVKNHKIAKNSKTTNARKKMSTDLELLDFFSCMTNFKNNPILLNKISHRFLLPTKLYSGWWLDEVSFIAPQSSVIHRTKNNNFVNKRTKR
jgi:hypothetical protein